MRNMILLLCGALLVGPAAGQSVILTINGDAATDQLGNAVGGVGDVDGDGFADVGVGIWKDDNTGADSGSVRIVSGKNGATLFTFNGDSAGDELGWAVDAAGDVNGDGFVDIVAGAIFDDDNAIDCGMLRVYSGKDGAILFTFFGDAINDNLGGDAGGAGDVNNDGFPDVVGGMDRHDLGGTDAGSARVYSGANGVVLYTFTGDTALDNFGFAVDGAGDVNGDGNDDVVVGTYLDDNNASNSGSVRVHSGASGAILYTFDGDSANDQLGWSVAGAGDVNGDGFADIVGGAFADDNNGAGSGMARVYSGATGAILHSFDGPLAGDQLGYSVEGGFDANRDGFADVIAGAWLADNGGASSGSATVYSGRDGSVMMVIAGAAGDRLGRAVAGAGDVDQDGFDDVIAGAFLADQNGTSSGSAMVVSGCDSQATPYGVGCAGSGGFIPQLGLRGCPSTGNAVTLEITGGLGGATALVLFGTSMGSTAMGGGCTLLVSPVLPLVGVLPLSAAGPGGGAIAVDAVIPTGVATPATLTMQVIVVDAGVPAGHANSNGLLVVIAH